MGIAVGEFLANGIYPPIKLLSFFLEIMPLAGFFVGLNYMACLLRR